MALDFHRHAELLMAQAESEERLGNRPAALRLYSRAADAELAALEALPSDRARTQAVIGISAVALFRRAERWEDGLTAAYRLLGGAALPVPATTELEALLDELRTRRAAARLGLVPAPRLSTSDGRSNQTPPEADTVPALYCRACGDIRAFRLPE